MIRKLYTLLLFLVLGFFTASGKGSVYDHLDYGFEWGYTSTFYRKFHFNYTNDLGSRVDSQNSSLTYKSNGHIECFVGAKFAKFFTADLCTGYLGIYERRRVVPMALRGSYFLRGYARDGFKIFAEYGYLFSKSFNGQAGDIIKSGIGYRRILGNNFALDFAVSYQKTSDHPSDVYDTTLETAYVVNPSNLLRSDCEYQSINFSLSLMF